MSLLQKLLSIGMYNQQPKQTQQRQPQLNPDFKGVYRPVGNTLQEVYCPRCGSWECSHTQIPINIPGRVKTRYTANLNPFRPFTLVNKKEKVVQQGGTYYQHRFVCNKCGLIFM